MSLSDKQQAFVDEYLVNGFNGLKAYIKAYPDSSEESAQSSASRLLENAKVKTAIEEAQKENRKRSRMTQDEKLELLEEWMTDRENQVRDRISSLKAHNEMTGDNAPTKIEHSGELININYNKPKK